MLGIGVEPIARTHSIASCISHQSRSGSFCILSQTIQVLRYDIDLKLKSEKHYNFAASLNIRHSCSNEARQRRYPILWQRGVTQYRAQILGMIMGGVL